MVIGFDPTPPDNISGSFSACGPNHILEEIDLGPTVRQSKVKRFHVPNPKCNPGFCFAHTLSIFNGTSVTGLGPAFVRGYIILVHNSWVKDPYSYTQ